MQSLQKSTKRRDRAFLANVMWFALLGLVFSSIMLLVFGLPLETGNATFIVGPNNTIDQLAADVIDTSNNLTCTSILDASCIPPTVQSINGQQSSNIDITPGPSNNIEVVNAPGQTMLQLAPNLDFSQMSVSGTTMLGQQTTCANTLDASCVNVAGQSCMSPLDSSCLPNNAAISSVTAMQLNVSESFYDNVTIIPQDDINAQFIQTNILNLQGSSVLSCIHGATVDNSCFNLDNYTCSTQALQDSCIPAAITLESLTVNNELQVNDITCSGPDIPASCFGLSSFDTSVSKDFSTVESAATTLRFSGVANPVQNGAVTTIPINRRAPPSQYRGGGLFVHRLLPADPRTSGHQQPNVIGWNFGTPVAEEDTTYLAGTNGFAYVFGSQRTLAFYTLQCTFTGPACARVGASFSTSRTGGCIDRAGTLTAHGRVSASIGSQFGWTITRFSPINTTVPCTFRVMII